jgi:hypothetical protein
MGHSSRVKRQKGCSICSPGKFRDAGQSARVPLSTLRKLGKTRRITRHDLGDQGC